MKISHLPFVASALLIATGCSAHITGTGLMNDSSRLAKEPCVTYRVTEIKDAGAVIQNAGLAEDTIRYSSNAFLPSGAGCPFGMDLSLSYEVKKASIANMHDFDVTYKGVLYAAGKREAKIGEVVETYSGRKPESDLNKTLTLVMFQFQTNLQQRGKSLLAAMNGNPTPAIAAPAPAKAAEPAPVAVAAPAPASDAVSAVEAAPFTDTKK